MILRDDERKQRVERVLAAAARLVDPADPIGREARSRLPAATGLSPQGVDLGLVRHVETSVSDDDLASFIARAGQAPRVHVVLSANVFVGAVRALAIAVATAPRVWVRSSRRESVVAPLLVRALHEAEGPGFGVQVTDAVDAVAGDELHVYGRRESIRAVAQAAPAGVIVRGHGPGVGIAVLDADDEIARAATGLSWDIVPFDQRGCLSPRIAIVRGTADRGRALAERVAAELGARNVEVPRGRLDEAERTAGRLYRETMQAVGSCIEGESFAVGFDPCASRLLLPPTGRHLHVACVRDPDDVTALIEPLRQAITAVGALGRGPAVRAATVLVARARTPTLGSMQCPPLDGPVDLRDVQ